MVIFQIAWNRRCVHKSPLQNKPLNLAMLVFKGLHMKQHEVLGLADNLIYQFNFNGSY